MANIANMESPMNRCSKYSKQAAHQSGAGMIYMAFFIQIAAIFVILLGDMSQLVFEKIKLQQTVDEAALSAANIQAIGLNEIADLNRAAVLEHATARQSLSVTPPWYFKFYPEAVSRYHDVVLRTIDVYRRDANFRFARLAHDYAKDVVQKNLPGTSARLSRVGGASNTRLTDFRAVKESPIVYNYYASFCSSYGGPCTTASIWLGPRPGTRVTREAYFNRRNVTTVPAYATAPTVGFYNPNVRWVKSPQRTTYAAYKLETPQKRFAVGNTFLKSFFPKMTVYAAAKPTGGNIYQMSPTYVSRLEHMRNLRPAPAIPNLTRVDH